MANANMSDRLDQTGKWLGIKSLNEHREVPELDFGADFGLATRLVNPPFNWPCVLVVSLSLIVGSQSRAATLGPLLALAAGSLAPSADYIVAKIPKPPADKVGIFL